MELYVQAHSGDHYILTQKEYSQKLMAQLVARYVIANSSDWLISVEYIGA